MKAKGNDRRQGKTNDSQLKAKIIFYLLGVLVASFGIAFLLRWCFQKSGAADWLVSVFQRQFHLNYSYALNLYQSVFRDHSEIIQMTAIAVLFVALLCVTQGHFLKYFDRIGQMIDALPKEDTPISLPPEMSFLEYKLKDVRQAFRQRSMEAAAAEQRKNDLVVYLAHDIRTPLTSIIGYLSLLEEALDMPAEQRARYIHITLEQASRLEKMVDEFFEITRYNVQQILLEKEKIDLYYMLVQMLDELSGIMALHGNTAVLEADENLTVDADAEKLARVFNNILKNAVAYSDRGTEIAVSARQEGGKVLICVRNKGNTIPKEKLSKIFEKFYRLDEARNSASGGSGLGLAIAKEIVTAHGGTIGVVSENNTTSFEVALPAPQ